MTAKPRPSSALFTLAAMVTAVAALHFAREILLPLALATLIGFLLAPLADRLERLRIGRIPSVIAVVGVAFGVLGLLAWIVSSQLVDLSSNLDDYRDNIIAKVRSVTQGSETLKGVTRTIEDVERAMIEDEEQGQPSPSAAADAGAQRTDGQDNSAESSESDSTEGADATFQAEVAAAAARLFGADRQFRETDEEAVAVKVVSLPPSPLAQVQGWLGPLMAPLTAAGMVVVMVLFMLLEREDQRNRVLRLFGTSNLHATTEALTDIVDRVSRYLRMQFLINAGYGLCVGVGLALIGLPNAVMFGVLSFSLRFLPYIGPWISAVLPVAVSLAVTEGWTQSFVVIGLFVVLELIVNNVAEPLLYGNSIGVSGMGVILAAIFWTWLWGAVGLVLAMPLTVCLVVAARYVPSLRFITVMLGDQPTLSREERIYQRMLALDDHEVRELAEEYLDQDDSTPTDFYDHVLLPALQLAERDRHAGVLSDEQEQGVQEVARELVDEMEAKAESPGEEASAAEADVEPSSAASDDAPRARVLCVPLRDAGDETAALMLGQLLEAARLEPVFSPVGSLTSEIVESVEREAADMVVVSVLPPLPRRDSRLLCRQLRRRYPTLPILVGYWDGSAEQPSPELLSAKDDGEIVTTLAQAVLSARAIASRNTPHPRVARSPALTDSHSREAG